MDIKKRIEKFNKENKPFYIMEFERMYGLSMCESYQQETFNFYAKSIGEPIKRGRLYTHGNGHEWGCIFNKYFKDDPNLKEILMDCEAGGFYCYTNELSIMEDFGRRFKMLCDNENDFATIVFEALNEARVTGVYANSDYRPDWFGSPVMDM